MSRSHKRLQLLLLASSPMWLQTIGFGGTIDHGDLGLGARVGESIDLPGCDPLPEDPGLIPTLRTGWARMVHGQLHVTLSDTALTCPDANSITDPMVCNEAWILNYDLPEELQAVGTYQLSDHAVDWQLTQQLPTHGALSCASPCGSFSRLSGHRADGKGPDARLEILGINEQCITGRIGDLDLSGQVSPPPPQLNGAFRAIRCD